MMAQPLSRTGTDDAGLPACAVGLADDRGADEASARLAVAQQGILELRLEAAQSRVSALETELAAERLLLRRMRGELAKSDRALALQRDSGVRVAQKSEAAAAEITVLKQKLHEALRLRQQLEAQLVRAADALKARCEDVARLERAEAEFDARLKAAEGRQAALVGAHQQALQEMAERLEEQRGEVRLLQRALHLARDNRRALHDYIGTMPGRGLKLMPTAGVVPPVLIVDLLPDSVSDSPVALSDPQGAPSVACSQ